MPLVNIVYVPLPVNFEFKSDLSKGKITSVDKSREKTIGVVYKVLLPREEEDALGDDVEFADEGTKIWATECMLSNVNALPMRCATCKMDNFYRGSDI